MGIRAGCYPRGGGESFFLAPRYSTEGRISTDGASVSDLAQTLLGVIQQQLSALDR